MVPMLRCLGCAEQPSACALCEQEMDLAQESLERWEEWRRQESHKDEAWKRHHARWLNEGATLVEVG